MSPSWGQRRLVTPPGASHTAHTHTVVCAHPLSCSPLLFFSSCSLAIVYRWVHDVTVMEMRYKNKKRKAQKHIWGSCFQPGAPPLPFFPQLSASCVYVSVSFKCVNMWGGAGEWHYSQRCTFMQMYLNPQVHGRICNNAANACEAIKSDYTDPVKCCIDFFPHFTFGISHMATASGRCASYDNASAPTQQNQ